MDEKIDISRCAITTNTTSTISSFDLLSRTHVPPHHIPERHVVVSVWTHGARLRFIIVNPGSSITVWESEFTSANPPSEIESFPTPNDFNFSAGSLFLPASFRLAFVLRKAVLIWDGRSFACGTTCREFRIWKESNTGYMPHRTLTSTSRTSILPLLSPDGESIITIGDRGIDLWLTADAGPMMGPASFWSSPLTKDWQVLRGSGTVYSQSSTSSLLNRG